MSIDNRIVYQGEICPAARPLARPATLPTFDQLPPVSGHRAASWDGTHPLTRGDAARQRRSSGMHRIDSNPGKQARKEPWL